MTSGKKFAAVGIVVMLVWTTIHGGVLAGMITVIVGGLYTIVRVSREARAAR